MEEQWTLYCHSHIESGRRYIGMTSRTMGRRWSQHVTQSRHSKNGRWHFPNAIRKYGPQAFSHEVFEVCHSLGVANLAEECWIEFFDTRNPLKGFNLKRGGDHLPHPKSNPWDRPEYREKQLKNLQQLHSSPDFKKMVSEGVQRAVLDPVVRANISAGQKGKVLTPEHCEKLRQTSLSVSPETRAAMTAASWAPEVKARRIASMRASADTPESRARRSFISKEVRSRPEVQAVFTGRVLSAETRARIAKGLQSKTTTNTHKICKLHGPVPLEQCERVKSHTGVRFKCGLCKLDHQRQRRQIQ